MVIFSYSIKRMYIICTAIASSINIFVIIDHYARMSGKYVCGDINMLFY